MYAIGTVIELTPVSSEIGRSITKGNIKNNLENLIKNLNQ